MLPVLLGAGAVVVIVAVVLGALLLGPSERERVAVITARTTVTTTASETPKTTRSAYRSSTRPTPTSPTARTSSSKPAPRRTARSHPTDIAYVNAGYTPPPVSRPVAWPGFSTQAEAEQLSRRNRLYSRTTAGPVSCPYDPIDFQRDGVARSRQLLEATYVCLMPVWARALGQAGYDLPRGPLYLVDKDFTTPCGSGGGLVKIDSVSGYYCSGNMAIYLSVKERGRYLPDGARTYSTEIVLAHEIGHHVQSRAGILNASWGIRSHLKGEAALVENRRIELQAQCFAAMALAALAHSYGITPEELAVIVDSESQRTDSTHGNRRSVGLWFRTGLDAGGQIGRCNTFAAPPNDVA